MAAEKYTARRWCVGGSYTDEMVSLTTSENKAYYIATLMMSFEAKACFLTTLDHVTAK